MFTRNFYILSRGIIGAASPMRAIGAYMLVGNISASEFGNIILECGETYDNLFEGYGDYSLNITGSTYNGRKTGDITSTRQSATVMTAECDQNYYTYYENHNQTSNTTCCVSSEAYANIAFRFAEGILNDTSEVTLNDYKLDNYLFNDKLTLNIQRLNGGTAVCDLTNVTNSAITIREIGAFLEGINVSNPYITPTWGIQPNSSRGCALIWKVKLTTPITIPANSTKKVYIDFPLPS